MIINKFHKKMAGFTLVELMVVIVIISILLMLAFPNFQASQNRAKEAGVKSNMYIFHQCAEVYTIDWGGISAENAENLKEEAIANKYWKVFINPFTSKLDLGTTTLNTVSSDGLIDPNNFPAGNVAYKGQGNTYAIYGAGKDGGKAILNKGLVYYLTNE